MAVAVASTVGGVAGTQEGEDMADIAVATAAGVGGFPLTKAGPAQSGLGDWDGMSWFKMASAFRGVR